LADINEKLLDERLGALEAARSWSPRVISKLEGHIRSAEDEALFRINPFNFAGEKNIAEAEAIDLLLHATALGLFEMNWSLLCPVCSCIVESFRSLTGVHNHYGCGVCQIEYEATLDDYVSVTFTINPQIRGIAFHHPERLSARDYFMKYSGTTDGRLPDGTPFTVLKDEVTKVVGYLPPGETTSMTIEATEGVIIGASTEGRAALFYTIEGPPASAPQVIEVEYGDKVHGHTRATVMPGPITFLVKNTTGERGNFCLALLPAGFEFGQIPIQFVPFLSGKRLLTTQTFRDLFRSEVVRASEGISVKDIALLFTDLKGSTALYDRIGDLNAFALVHQHFDRLQSVTVRHNGAIIKTIGDAVMAAFLSPADAVRAALAMRTEIAAFNRGQADKELILKIGVHKGAAIAVTLNERLDYFGQTVNIAARVQNLADADEVYLSKDVYDAADVKALLTDLAVVPVTAQLRGVQQEVPVFRVSPVRPAEARVA
jgi:class 3 adenylate cyclase